MRAAAKASMAAVHDPNRSFLTGFCVGFGETLVNQKQIERSNEKKNDGVAAQSIGEAFPSRGIEVFLYGQRPNVSHSTAGEIARAGMVNGMFPFPVIVGSEGKQTRNEAECCSPFWI